MTKKKEKPLSIFSNQEKVKQRIALLEEALGKTPGFPSTENKRNEIKLERRALYRLRKRQKDYTPPPKKITLKGL